MEKGLAESIVINRLRLACKILDGFDKELGYVDPPPALPSQVEAILIALMLIMVEK